MRHPRFASAFCVSLSTNAPRTSSDLINVLCGCELQVAVEVVEVVEVEEVEDAADGSRLG